MDENPQMIHCLAVYLIGLKMQVALIVADISWCRLPISQYKASLFEARDKGALLLAAAAIMSSRCGYCAVKTYTIVYRLWTKVQNLIQ